MPFFKFSLPAKRSVSAAAALMSGLTVMAVLMAVASAGMPDTIHQLGFLQAAALRTLDLISMLAALTARLLFPDLTARCTFKYTICHGIAFFLGFYYWHMLIIIN